VHSPIHGGCGTCQTKPSYRGGIAPKPDPKRDEPVKIDLDPEVAYRTLTKVDQGSALADETTDEQDEKSRS
jgi:hypothetical protein